MQLGLHQENNGNIKENEKQTPMIGLYQRQYELTLLLLRFVRQKKITSHSVKQAAVATDADMTGGAI